MNKLNIKDVIKYVEDNIGDFHQKRLAKVENIKLKDVLKAKNPYLFKTKHVNSASEIIDGILSASISSSEESIFGNWLERLAIFINNSVYTGRKAVVDGIDLDFDKGGSRYLVAIKSGPEWGNHSSIKKMRENFSTARKRLSTSGSINNAIFINGCCYGKSNLKTEYKSNGDYHKMCGQRFWELISGDPDLYLKLIEPLGHEAFERNEEFTESYTNLKNRLVKEFLIDFTNVDGSIAWEKLVKFNSFTEPKLVKLKPIISKKVIKQSISKK